MSFLIQYDLSKSITDVPPHPFPFALDPFQQAAWKAITKQHQLLPRSANQNEVVNLSPVQRTGDNVLVCAKTGSGKTLVGLLGIHKALQEKKRVFYTAPIKSLSNQKFHDLKGDFPSASVGIMTGDIKDTPDAQIVVMTTEILLNLLKKRGSKTESVGLTSSLSLDNLGAIIFDECHYINDPSRGKVWEETMILAPPEVQLILLSATLEKPETFARWLGELKQVPVHLIQTEYRIVPLTHGVLDPITDELVVTQTPGVEVYQDQAYRKWLQTRDDILKGHATFKQKVANKVILGEKGGVEGKVRPKSFPHQLNHTLDLLKQRGQLPALFFVFSRKGCETLANQVTHSFLDGSESSNVEHIMNYHLHSYKSLESLPQYHTLKSLLLKGIAFHHSGLLPLLKEIVEILFSKGLVKLLFATETFAVGLNMPTKTVVFTGLSKYDDNANGMRLLRSDEYVQMAGRAGRRGKDTEGLVLYLPERDPVSSYELHQIMKGSRAPVISRMRFDYSFLLKTLNAGNTGWLQLMEKSYWFEQRRGLKVSNQAEIDRLAAVVARQEAAVSSEDRKLLSRKQELEQEMRAASSSKRKRLQIEYDGNKGLYDSLEFKKTADIYDALLDNQRMLKSLQDYQDGLEAHAATLDGPVKLLKSAMYLKDDATEPKDLKSDALLEKGILATEINEGHPLLMTELFTSKAGHALTGPELATLLSVFLEDFDKDSPYSLDELDIPSSVKDAALGVSDDARLLAALEEECGCERSSLDLSIQWLELVYRWLTEPDVHMATLCTDYNTFEGNVVRGLLKLANLVDEWVSLATLSSHADQIEKLVALKPQLIRDIVMPNSLYLRL
jgi:superfamily II RNA helicase